MIAVANSTVLAVGIIAVSTIAIVASIVFSVRHRARYDPATDERVLDALDQVAWYADTVGHDIQVKAERDGSDSGADSAPATVRMLSEADRRITGAQEVLFQLSTLDGCSVWQDLAEALATTKATYDGFVNPDSIVVPAGETVAPVTRGMVQEHQTLLKGRLSQVRKYLS